MVIRVIVMGVLLLGFSSLCWAQVQKDSLARHENVLILKDGSMFTTDEFSLESGFLGKEFFLLNDGTKIRWGKLQYYKEGAILQTRINNIVCSSLYNEPLNLFTIVTTTTTSQGGFSSSMSTDVDYYYSSELGEIVKLHKGDLLADMKLLDTDKFRKKRSQIMGMVRRGDQVKKTRKIGLASSISAILAGALMVNFIDSPSMRTGGSFVALAGIGGVFYFRPKKYDQHYLNAANLYNNVYLK